MAHRGETKTFRYAVLAVTIAAVIALGMTTPTARATFASRIIVFAFSFSLAVAMVTIIALIPSPADPRERLRQIINAPKREPAQSAGDPGAEFQGSVSAGPPTHQPGADDG